MTIYLATWRRTDPTCEVCGDSGYCEVDGARRGEHRSARVPCDECDALEQRGAEVGA